MDNTINTNSYINNYTNYCAYRLPCGICERTNNICPLNGRTQLSAGDITCTSDINSATSSIHTTAWNTESEEKMEVIERKPIPIYEVECYECHSKIQYKASEVSWCQITCPVCGTSLWANTIFPVRMESEEENDK